MKRERSWRRVFLCCFAWAGSVVGVRVRRGEVGEGGRVVVVVVVVEIEGCTAGKGCGCGWLFPLLVGSESGGMSIVGIGRGMCAAGGDRRPGEFGETGSRVSSTDSRVPPEVCACVNPRQFHLTSVLVLALPDRARPNNDAGLSRSLMVSVAELRREHGVDESSPW
jgi:hypothetical protein